MIIPKIFQLVFFLQFGALSLQVLVAAKQSDAVLHHEKRQESTGSDCGGEIDGAISSQGVITSPNYPNQYPLGLSCRWKIKGGRGRRVVLQFQDFDLTQTDNCQEDFVIISSEDPSNNDTKKIQLCGSEIPSTVISDNDVLYLEMRTSSGGDTCKGFSANYALEEAIAVCGSEISALEFDFVSTNYPQMISNETSHCHLSVSHDCDIPICQVKLDFIEFELQPPDLGDCKADQFIIQANDPIPVLCGSNAGQHVYIDVERRASTEIHILTSPIFPKPFGHVEGLSGEYNVSNWLFETDIIRKFKIRFNQIPCNCTYDRTSSCPRAPDGCLQYFVGVTGVLQSFNFNGVRNDLDPCWIGNERECNQTRWTGHLNNLDYHICVRAAEDYCGIVYDTTGSESFILTGQAKFNSSSNGRVNLFGSSVCKSDYIVVPRSRTIGTSKIIQPRDRYCGNALGNSVKGPIVSYSKPFQVQFKTDADEFTGSLDTENRGFELEYTQLPCSGLSLFNSDKK